MKNEMKSEREMSSTVVHGQKSMYGLSNTRHRSPGKVHDLALLV